MSKKEIVIADVVDKYDNPIAELVQVACQFSSSLYLVPVSYTHLRAHET